jgi:hypothetical protein
VKGLSFYTAFGGSGGLPPLCVYGYGRVGGEMLKEFLFLLVAYDRGNGKTEKEFFNPSNVAGFILVEANSI